jgi:hypothetical protein
MQQAPSRARGGPPDDTVEEFHPLQVGMQLQEVGRNPSMQKVQTEAGQGECNREHREQNEQGAIAEPTRSRREILTRLHMLTTNIHKCRGGIHLVLYPVA